MFLELIDLLIYALGVLALLGMGCFGVIVLLGGLVDIGEPISSEEWRRRNGY